MAGNKTNPTDASVTGFLAAIDEGSAAKTARRSSP